MAVVRVAAVIALESEVSAVDLSVVVSFAVVTAVQSELHMLVQFKTLLTESTTLQSRILFSSSLIPTKSLAK